MGKHLNSIYRKKDEEKKDEAVKDKEKDKMPVDGENNEGGAPKFESFEQDEVVLTKYYCIGDGN